MKKVKNILHLLMMRYLFKMNCSKCNSSKNKVLESRKVDVCIRRRRECLDCSFRFSTQENIVLQKNKAERSPLVNIRRRGHTKAPSKSKRTDSFYIQNDDIDEREFIDSFLKGKL